MEKNYISFGFVLILFMCTDVSCTDPESFVRGGPTLSTLFVLFRLMRGGRIQRLLKSGQLRPTSETPLKWRFAGVPMVTPCPPPPLLIRACVCMYTMIICVFYKIKYTFYYVYFKEVINSIHNTGEYLYKIKKGTLEHFNVTSYF